MEDINTTISDTTISDTATIARRVLRPGLIIQALVFTGILHFSVVQTPQDTIGVTDQAVQRGPTLSPAVGDSVLHYAAQQSSLPTAALRIVHAQPQTWSDNCLGLDNSRVSCTQLSVPGWQVAVASGQQRWIYRTNASGSVIKLERGTALFSQRNPSVVNGQSKR